MWACGVTARLFNDANHGICDVVSHIFNLSTSSSVFPDLWKTVVVSPLFKDSSREESTNHRPISLLPICSKLLERIIHNRIYNHLRKTIYYRCTVGFRKRHCTLTCLLNFLDGIFKEIDAGRLSGVLFLDLKKPFTMVNHALLLNKLIQTGIDSTVVSWIASYLSNRYQVCRVNDVTSGALPVSYRVPQGSILVPLLFVVFLNNLSDSLMNGCTHLYADDTAITVSSASVNDLVDTLKMKLGEAAKWMVENHLSLNMTRMKTVFFGMHQTISRTNGVSIRFGNVEIQTVETFK